MRILGLGGLQHDAACAVLNNGKIAAAVEQEKVARRHIAGAIPTEAIDSALELAKLKASDIDCVAIAAPAADLHLRIRARFPNARLTVVEHQAAHAASAYYASGFEQARVLTLDRRGEFRCGALWNGASNELHLDREMYYPDSAGEVYSRVTEFLGFEADADEHKVQWLSASGTPRFQELFEELLPTWDGARRDWFDANRVGRGGFGARFYDRLGLKDGETPAAGDRPDIAASLQQALQKSVIALAGEGENLCLAGGMFLNTMLVAALENSGKYKNVFVQPEAGNAGTALGAIYHAWHHVSGQKRRIPPHGMFLGPSYEKEEIKQVVENCKLRFRFLLTTDELLDAAVEAIYRDRIVAWMHGRMEFGPRALGNRSILASPLNPYSTENLNAYIKHREGFRKFAASVPAELAGEYFETGPNARSLATVGRVRPAHKERFEAAILGDNLVRVHTVREEDNPLYWKLLHRAGKASGLPVLYNTSFNLFGDPLVCSPRDAVRSFYSSGIDALFAGHFLVEK